MQSKADEYRARALECKEIAASARDHDIKRQFEELAEQWWQIANLIEQQQGR